MFECTGEFVLRRCAVTEHKSWCTARFSMPERRQPGKRDLSFFSSGQHIKLIDLRFYNYLKIRPTLHPVQALRLLLGSPTMTVVAAWARLRQR